MVTALSSTLEKRKMLLGDFILLLQTKFDLFYTAQEIRIALELDEDDPNVSIEEYAPEECFCLGMLREMMHDEFGSCDKFLERCNRHSLSKDEWVDQLEDR